MLLSPDLNIFFGDYSVALDNNPCQISWKYHVKYKSCPYKDLIFINQLPYSLSHSNPIWTISSETVPFPKIIIHAKFRKEILTPTWSDKEQLLGEKSTCAKFQIDISKTEKLVYVYTNRQTWLNRLNTSPWSF